MSIKHFSIRLDEELLCNLRIVAKAEGRSANRQIIYIIKQYLKHCETYKIQME